MYESFLYVWKLGTHTNTSEQVIWPHTTTYTPNFKLNR